MCVSMDSRRYGLKGVEQPVTIYDVQGLGGKYNLFLPDRREKPVLLAQAIPISFRVLEEKRIVDISGYWQPS